MRRACCTSLLLFGLSSHAAAHEAWGIVSDPRGRVFFTDVRRNVIWRLDPDGTRVPVLEDTHSHALVSIGDGSVYGTHTDHVEPVGRVWRLDPTGRVHAVLGSTRDLPLGLESFLIDADGTIYSAIRWAPPNRVMLLRRRPDGIAERVATGFSEIDGMAWAPDGAILLTDGAFLKRVHEGTVETLGGGALTQTSGGVDLMGVTTDGSGGAFVADFAGGRILAVGRQSGVAQEYGSNFPWSPAGIARDANGLVVLEQLKLPWSRLADLHVGPYLRVRRLGIDGQVVTLAVLWGRRTGAAAAVLALAVVAATLWRLRTYHRQHRDDRTQTITRNNGREA